MKKIFLAFLMLLAIGKVQGQILVENLSLSSYNDQTKIQALKSITLTNGFNIPLGKTVTINVTGFQNIVSQPSLGQNYVITKTYRSPGVTLGTLNTQRTIGEENQVIQYLDGFGRPLQAIQLMASPNYKDIIQYNEYDGFNRESIKYVPYADQSGNGSFRLSAKTSQADFYKSGIGWDPASVKTDYPYSVTVYENSPLNRVEQQGATGAIWQPASSNINGSGHTKQTEYGTNTDLGIEIVKLWTLTYDATGTPSGATGIAKYAKDKLYKSTTKDENWTSGKAGTTDEYKDYDDRIVLRRVWKDNSNMLDTYYVYDDIGNLCYVIPPAVKVSSFTETTDTFKGFIYAYRYDELHRLVEKKIPGKGWEWLIYNVNDKVVLTQDALQREKPTKEWNYTKYDAFGRVVESGLYESNAFTDRNAAQEAVNTYKVNNVSYYWEDRIGTPQNSDRTFPGLIGRKPLIVNYYDDYSFTGSETAGLGSDGITRSDKIKGLLTGSVVASIDGSQPLMTILYYDDYGRVIRSASQNHLSGTDVETNTYLFSGELKTSKREHKASPTGSITTILTTNEYDHVGRLIEKKKKMNNLSEISQSKLIYNEIGQLKQKNLHNNGAASVQEIAYGYNERGWIKSINDPLSVTGKRLFGLQLIYGDKEDSFNGNISSMVWNTKTATLLPTQSYTYNYDKLNRLRSGVYRTAATNFPENKMNYYDEEIVYDDMGNIDSLRRRNGNSTTWYNNFKYTYSGNQLTKVTDIGSSLHTNNFVYDVNGNLISNARLGISKIEYNHLNLPIKYLKGGELLLYRYDAQGKKLNKTLGGNETQYVDGIQYKNGAIEFIQTEEGRILPNNGSFIYEYFLRDHLGDIRAIVDHNGVLKQVQDYYPFGMDMNQGNSLNATGNLYKYNGKEKQLELGLEQLDYGARFYDAEIARWGVIDPLSEQSRRWSPYAYAVNNPIRYVDPDGMSATPIPTSIVYMEGAEAIAFFKELLSVIDKGKQKGKKKSDRDNEHDDPPAKKNKQKIDQTEKKEKTGITAAQYGTAGAIAMLDGPEPFIADAAAGAYLTYSWWISGGQETATNVSAKVSPGVQVAFMSPLEILKYYLMSKGGPRNVWPDEYGPPPTTADTDWSKSDSQLANEAANRVGDTLRGSKTAHNRAKKVFNSKRPKRGKK
ncbi:DUF6443 domain-containing protein [Sphingobacterium paramultivorum]|uniref:DUF6443 domain-containing protein n=1 Tax=Sphingobacterium paramultivorum TaxID=2886510 RepID=UPI00129CBA4D|nr:DUF6443 domain-containing protein [Sphingobacterium paramultivorum]